VTQDDHALARDLATEAGALLLRLRSDRGFGDIRALRDAGDRESHVYLTEALARQRPDDSVLSEEGKDELSRLDAERVWIVDPLDGTREFGEDPRIDWAVHVALVEKGFPTASAVALPARGMTLSTVSPPVLPPALDRPPVLVVSRTRPPAETEIVRAALGGELLPMGSAGAKAMAVVLGEADVYVHGGGQWEWDSAAPVGVAAAAGLHVSRLDGSPLVYNQLPPWLPDLVICRPELAEAVLAAAASAATG
jgi:3'(2'), 5'-bisphosphate nucleotidase